MTPDGWEVRKLGDVIKLGSGDTKPKDLSKESSESNPYPVYGGNNIMGYSGQKNSDAPIILIGRVGEYCGVTRYVDRCCWVTDNALFTRKVDSHVDIEYLAIALNSYGLSRLRNKGGQPLISQKPIYGLKFSLPPLGEQRKIAQILSNWDKSITITGQLLANSQQQKKALGQQLLTGSKRFSNLENSNGLKKTTLGIIPEDWEYVKISDVCEQISRKNIAGENYPVLSCSKYHGFIDSLKYFKKRVYSDDTRGYKIIPRGCFGFPANHIEEGSIGLQEVYDIGIVSPIYVVFRADKERVNNEYLYALLKTEHYRQIFSAATNSSVDRRGSLRWKEFGSIHVPLPPLAEQNKIAAVIATAQEEVEVLRNKLDALKEEKKALMQQLLTGNRRVQI